MGIPMRLMSVGQFVTLDRHRVVVHIQEASIPLVLREGLVNDAEAQTAVRLARATPNLRHIATSVCDAQCRAIAKRASESGIDNLRIVLPERLGRRPFSNPPHLIVSLAVPNIAMASGWPLSDLGWVVPLLIGDWARITILCAPDIYRFHPVVRHLVSDLGSNGEGSEEGIGVAN
jgi:hypothetical protein